VRRTAAVLSVAVLLAIAPVASANARPTREYLPLPDRIVLNGVCPHFSIVADILVNREYGITFSDANGDPARMLTQGSLVVRLTNRRSDISVVRNISGPGETIFHADGSTTLTTRGTWFLFFTAGQRGPGTPADSIVHRGRMVILTHPDGSQTIESEHGITEDLCATLS
jgi:hypothetical protein